MIPGDFDAERFAEGKAGSILKILGASHISFTAKIIDLEIGRNSAALAFFGG